MESMTGVATTQLRLGGIQLEILMRSINHRYLDIHIRAPGAIHALSGLMDEVLREHFRRGRLDIEIRTQELDHFQRARIQKSLANTYLGWLGVKNMQSLSPEARLQLLRMPGVVELEAALPGKQSREKWRQALVRAARQLQKSRRAEGRKIAVVLRGYLGQVETHLRAIQQEQRASRTRRRREMQTEIERRLQNTQPGAWIAEWLDRGSIAEELERLKMHVTAIRAMLKEPQAEIGKRLDFYGQELLREANTIASKAKDFAIRARVIEIKTIVEDIKEQGRNLC